MATARVACQNPLKPMPTMLFKLQLFWANLSYSALSGKINSFEQGHYA